ncbi:diaminopimelate epimerase [Parvularcula bermudensis HTCC2503]|uniref:Diaminopimelate epimerase n=2 Tax=Parvularcula TaxID=208215 RepID=E0TEK4_PARBH|nr:diaminopimelate epimerase [Parvularcula bermudensis HTCC2503]
MTRAAEGIDRRMAAALWAGGLICVAVTPNLHQPLAARAAAMTAAPGTDLSLWVGGLIAGFPGLGAEAGLLLGGLLCLTALVAAAMGGVFGAGFRGPRGLILACHPLILAPALTGYGAVPLLFFALWRSIALLPIRAPDQSLPLLGLTLAAITVGGPGGSHWLLPLLAVLFLAAPRHLIRRHMRVFYGLILTPAAMIGAVLLYLEAVGMAPRQDPLPPVIEGPGGLWGLVGAVCVILLTAPSLLRPKAGRFRGPQLVAVLAIVFVSGHPSLDPIPLVIGAAMAGHGLDPRGGRLDLWQAAGVLGSALVLWVGMATGWR